MMHEDGVGGDCCVWCFRLLLFLEVMTLKHMWTLFPRLR